jgi:hypothetical protein
MAKDRVIVDFKTPDDAKKVEETVKTGYAEAVVEVVLQWMAAEEDIRDSYSKMAQDSSTPSTRTAYESLKKGSESNIEELRRLLKTLESLDRAQVSRIELLGSLLS